MSLKIPNLNTLYAIIKRDIDNKNDRLEYRKELAKELKDNCQEWARVLVETFNNAIERWEEEGRDAAANEIMDLEMDFLRLNYHSLREDSPIIKHLHKDGRFADFAEACCQFYKSALYVKRIVYGQIKNDSGKHISSNDTTIDIMVTIWCDEVKRMLENVRYKWMEIQTLEKK